MKKNSEKGGATVFWAGRANLSETSRLSGTAQKKKKKKIKKEKRREKTSTLELHHKR